MKMIQKIIELIIRKSVINIIREYMYKEKVEIISHSTTERFERELGRDNISGGVDPYDLV